MWGAWRQTTGAAGRRAPAAAGSLRAIAIDWSGALRGARRKIWLAEAIGARLVRLEAGRGREEMRQHLLELAEADPRVVVGLDFAFSLPAWFLQERGLCSARELWALASQEAEDWLAACSPPFWGRRGKPCPATPARLRFRRTDLAVPATGGIRPKSVFQVGGAGAVGSGSLRGMAMLDALRSAGFSVWPFDPPGWPRVVEIYPRVLTGRVRKSDRRSRIEYLRTRHPELTGEPQRSAESSEDAFDAAISALTMAAHLRELANLQPTTDPQLALEGLIWLPRNRGPR